MSVIGPLFVLALALLALARLGQHLGDPERRERRRAERVARRLKNGPGFFEDLLTTARTMLTHPKQVSAADVFIVTLVASFPAVYLGFTVYAAFGDTGMSHAAAPGIGFLALIMFGALSWGGIFWGPALAAAVLWKLIVWPQAQPKPQKPVSFLSGGPTERQLLERQTQIAERRAEPRGLLNEDELAAIADALSKRR